MLAEVFEAMLRNGVLADAIEEEIGRPERDRTELIWPLKRRLEGQGSKQLFAGAREFLRRGQ
jgi:hypothetical protein